MTPSPISPFDIKSATIQGLSLVLRTADMALIESELADRVAGAGDLFTNAPVLINVSALATDGTAETLELACLVERLAQHTMRAVGIVGATGPLLDQAQALGLIEEEDILPRARRKPAEPAPVSATPAVVIEASAERAPDRPAMADLFDPLPTAAPTDASAAPHTSAAPEQRQTAPTRVIDRALRSGQRVYARGGDLVVLGPVSHGAEVIADGNIHVYGPLRGRAIAGATGDADARIFAAAMEAELVAIAGTYRTTDTPLSDDVLGKPAQVRLDGDRLLVEPLKS